MGFINSLLKEEEVKKFKALNVSFGKKRISIVTVYLYQNSRKQEIKNV